MDSTNLTNSISSSAIEFYNSWKRLCIYHSDEPCLKCPLFKNCITPTSPEDVDPAEAVKTVARWATEHPSPSIDDCLEWLRDKRGSGNSSDDLMYYSVINWLRELKSAPSPVEVKKNDYFAAP